MKQPLLVVDIGNTSTTTGLYVDGVIKDLHRFLRRDGAEGNVRKAVETYKGNGVGGISVASVVPDLTPVWRQALRAGLGCPDWELVPGAPLEITVTYPKPATIGADRLANAVAAVRLVGAPVIVADFGTALTFDIVTRAEGYVGGVIAPGIGLMYRYLAEKTALLPQIDPAPAGRAIGKSTVEAMHAGAYFGYRGMVREIYREIVREMGQVDVPLLATGGDAPQILQGFDEPFSLQPDLTLLGLAYAWDHAQPGEN